MLADVVAQVLDLDDDELSCQWIVTAHPTQRIGVSIVNVTINFHHTTGGILLDIVDDLEKDKQGRPVVLKEWRAQSWREYVTVLKPPVVSHTNQITIDYKRQSRDRHERMIDFKLLVYVCGGDSIPNEPFQSPLLNTTPLHYLPEYLSCKWYFEKPNKEQFYILKVTDIEGAPCLNISKSDGEFYNISTQTLGVVPKRQVGEQLYDPSQAMKNPLVIPKKFIEYCSVNNFSVAFTGSNIEIVYSVLHLTGHESFRAVFGGHPATIKKRIVPWYLNYCNLVVFVPLGLLLGILFVIYQRKDSLDGGPTTLRSMKMTNERGQVTATFLAPKQPKTTSGNRTANRYKPGTSKQSQQWRDEKAASTDALQHQNENVVVAAAANCGGKAQSDFPERSDKSLLDRALKRVSFR